MLTDNFDIDKYSLKNVVYKFVVRNRRVRFRKTARYYKKKSYI